MRIRPTQLGAQWEGIEVHLGFPPQLVGGQPYVHRLDIRKTLNPLLLQPRIAALAGQPMVVIDPGHGGEDPGTLNINGGPHEKSFALDWALRLQRRLLAAGWQAALTRTNDAYLSLADRVAIADRLRADVFISLHFNSASPNTNLWGIETYCLTPTGSASHLTRGFFDGPEQAFPNNAFDVENLQLACRVHRAVMEIPGNRDRGVRRARFLGVLRPQQRPAILIEGGYLSNPEEARRIATETYREALAEAVARALLGIEGGARIATVAPPGAGTPLTP
jgi:N-acetylmuramoyl-L-alanine amidase